MLEVLIDLISWCGEWDLRQNIEARPVQGRDIQSIVMHPEYNYDLKNISNYKYDIAVLFTTKDFFLNRHFNTLCLPSVNDMFDGRKCIATGWEKGNGILKKKTMPIVNNTFCQVGFYQEISIHKFSHDRVS